MILRDYQRDADLYKLPESKKRAQILNVKFFFNGKKCPKGHLDKRYTSSSNCVKCIEENRNVVFSNFRGKSSVRSPENQKLALDACIQGKTIYKSLTACKKGHLERYITTNNCVECDKHTQEKRKLQNRWRRIKKKYGITKEQFFEIKKIQNNKCAICKSELTNKNQHVDHCHTTGKVRGILCINCNQGIGSFLENTDRLKGAIKYIELHNG